MPNGYGYTDETGQKVSALRDMFDGGGPGQRGDQFRGGGAISALANALKIRPLGSTAPREEIGFRGRMGSREYFRDMFDGGGAGRSSSAGFEGGPYSGLGNVLMDIGLLRPLGAHRGSQQMAPLRPTGLGGVGASPLSTFGAPPAQADLPFEVYPVAPPPEVETQGITEGGETYADILSRALANTARPSAIDAQISANNARIAEIDRLLAARRAAQPAPTMATPPMNPDLYNMIARRTGNLSRTFRPAGIVQQSRRLYGVGGF